MIHSIIILLMLIHLKLFKGWFLALWIIDIVVRAIDFILKVIAKVLEGLK